MNVSAAYLQIYREFNDYVNVSTVALFEQKMRTMMLIYEGLNIKSYNSNCCILAADLNLFKRTTHMFLVLLYSSTLACT